KTHTFRIPSLVTTRKGTVLVFCEARRESGRDHSNIDLVLKRSDDGGASWGAMRVLFDDGPHTVGNPCAVLDRRTGTIWLTFSKNNKQVLLSS
ncbi:MAG TPA: exo-alpha-sialidase, partial [Planctomycetaceae bacterium]|nr:exo-alpha-sialidase [Planctomycetaceae bacterium]